MPPSHTRCGARTRAVRSLGGLAGAGLLLLGAACGEAPAGLQGRWTLSAETAHGEIRGTIEAGRAGCSERAVEIGLWGERFGTRGVVAGRILGVEEDGVEEDGVEEDGGTWLSFPVRTGLGEGTAELLLGVEAARLPLGVREGEHEVLLAVQPGLPPEDERAAWAEASAARLDVEQAAWARGGFRILDGEALVGDVRFRGDGPAHLALYDETWLTDGVVAATVHSEGPELVLTFLVEPSLEGEEGRLRLNLPTGSLVVPMAPSPVPGERRLALEPGFVEPGEREALQAAARRAADEAEEALLRELVPGLLAASEAAGAGACAPLEDLAEEWQVLLRGYEVRIAPRAPRETGPAGGRCVAELRPAWEQHGRRFRGRLPDVETP